MYTSSSEPMHHGHCRPLIEGLSNAPKDQPFVTMWNNEEDVQRVSFGEFTCLAEAQAAHLQECGLQAGETVVMILPQSIELMAAFVGAMLLGAVPTILAYPNSKVEPSKFRSGLSGVSANLKARFIVVDELFPRALLEYVAVAEGGQVIRSVSSRMPTTQVAGFTPIGRSDGLAFIQHSAGTTGLQKGVALSHGPVLRQLDHLAKALRVSDQDCVYSWLPLYHDMGLIACFILPLVYHLPVVMQSPMTWVMQPATMLELISEHRCTLAWVPNFALQLLARRVRPEDRSRYDLSCLRALINCSEPVRAQSMDEFSEAFASCGLRTHVLQSSYAMAENVFAVTQSRAGDQFGPRRLWVDGHRLRDAHIAVPVGKDADGAICQVSSGQCLEENRVRIVSSAGEDLPVGEIGEILIRSDSLFDGYYNRPELTATALRNGWYWSGDLGFVMDGELYVTGRKKDLIIVAGKNIYPQDVEEIVCSHPAIYKGRAVAFPVFNADLGTEDIVVVAEVREERELSNAPAIERAIRSAIVAELGVTVRAMYLKPPRWIVKSTAGKPARSITRDKLLAEYPELTQGQP